MYSSSRGNDNNNNTSSAYAQQQQQQSKSQTYLGPDDLRHSALLSSHPSAGAHYGGQYASVYGSSALNAALQVPATSAKGAGPSGLEARSGYGSAMQDSPKYTAGDFLAATQKYGQLTDLPPADRLLYAERPSAYSARDLQHESTVRLADSIAYAHQQKADIYDRLDAATLRQELLHAQSLQPVSADGSSRQADYLATRAVAVRHAGQDLLPYGGRLDADLRTLSLINGTQHAPSILGAAPRRDVEDLLYAHSSANPGYGAGLPPGRAYASDYPGGIVARAVYARLDDRKDDLEYAREIDRREEDRRRETLREREQERERERERERDRDRERERERDRERERERERERRRERERILDRREKERDKRERTPPRVSRDRGRSVSVKAGRSSRLESPRVEASHRRRSPIKEKQREYDCKVYSYNLLDVERDYLSMDRRYSRLYVSPECAKVVVNWSREDLNIPLKTPISFEHDFVEEETRTEASVKKVADDHVKLESGTTRWNAKMLLMSGLSRNAWEELSSERRYEDRIPHLCNMLRFAFLKDGSSLMAIGGSWDTVDGNDPSLDKSSLVQTVLRYAKELTGLDLKNCRHWNPFLEIHYDRVGKDGRFSHKEVTVLYIPDLSDCLPSIDAWRDQWLSNKKAIAERERLQALKGKKLHQKKEAPKDKEPGTTKDLKKVDKADKKKEAGSNSKVNAKGKSGTKDKAKEAVKDDKNNAVIEKKKGAEIVGEGSNSGKKILTDNVDVQTPGSGKKKIIRKVVKKKVAAEKDDAVDSKNVEKTAANTEVVNEATEPSATPSTVKTSTTKKTTVKKKIVKKVIKKKVAIKKDEVAKESVTSTTIGKQTAASENQETEVKSKNNKSVSEKKKEEGGSSEIKHKDKKIQVKEEKKAKADGSQSGNNKKSMDGKERKDKDGKVEVKIKEVKDKKKAEEPPRHPGFIIRTKGHKRTKLRSLSLSLDSLLNYTDENIEESTFELSIFAETFYEMLQHQMGSRILTFLQKLRTKFLSKMNQKKRRREEVSDKKEKERTSSAKKSSPKRLKTEDGTVESKSIKTETLQEASSVDEKIVVNDEKIVVNDENMLTDNVDSTKPEDELNEEEDPEKDPDEDPEEDPDEDPEEDPEKDPEEDENMEEASPQNDAENEEKTDVENVGMEVKSKNMDTKVKEEQEETTKVTVSSDDKSKVEKKENPKVDTKKKNAPLDKELLQAFRFFDRNRVGFVRVEDLRLILHALGKSMSHRDVKELVQSALLESSTGRDDRVRYSKLVKMTDI